MEQTSVSDAELILACIRRFSAAECAVLADNIGELQNSVLTGDRISSIIGRPLWKRKENNNIEEYQKLLAHIRRMMSYYEIKSVRFGQAEYPRLLPEIYDPPFLLFYRGDIAILNDCCCGIVGTRKPSVEGYSAAFAAGQALGTEGITVASGLAFGIDTAAHKGCIAGKGKTAAVMAGGLDSIAPHRNQNLALRIIETGGVLVSEYVPGEPMDKYHFPQRNRIISGVSSGVFIVQAPEKSGALITADFAIEQNRSVYIQQNLLDHALNGGCRRLSYDGAAVFATSDGLVAAVKNEFSAPKEKSAGTQYRYQQQMLFDV